MPIRDHFIATFPLDLLRRKERIILYPAASGSEYVLSFFRERCPDMLERIVGLGDADPNKASLRQNGLLVHPAGTLAGLKPDAVLVTSPSSFRKLQIALRSELGDDIPVLLADDMAEYLAYEAERSRLVRRADALACDPDQEAPPVTTWFQCMPFGQGRFTRSDKGALTFRLLDQIALPADLGGLSVLDLGASDGFYGFECEARNAAAVTAVEGPAWRDPAGWERFRLAHRQYGSRVQTVASDVEEFLDRPQDAYDLVLALGLYYHLRDPFLFFRKLRSLTRGTLLVSGRTVSLPVFDPINLPAATGLAGNRSASILLMSDRHYGKWTANLNCLQDMLRLAGFARTELLFNFCPEGSVVASTALAAHVD